MLTLPELNLATNISLIWRNQSLPMVIIFLFIEIKYHSIILPAVIIYFILVLFSWLSVSWAGALSNWFAFPNTFHNGTKVGSMNHNLKWDPSRPWKDIPKVRMYSLINPTGPTYLGFWRRLCASVPLNPKLVTMVCILQTLSRRVSEYYIFYIYLSRWEPLKTLTHSDFTGDITTLPMNLWPINRQPTCTYRNKYGVWYIHLRKLTNL